MNPGSKLDEPRIDRGPPSHRELREQYRHLEHIGRIRLSTNFFLRDFLHSEIGIAYGIPNTPDNIDLAIETGQSLCQQILEPLQKRFGAIHIRSGFRSARLNAFGARRRLNCARNERNFGYHIWDHKDAQGAKGAAACIVLPWLVDNHDQETGCEWMARYIHEHLPYHRVTFFRKYFAFNIGWNSSPLKEIYTYYPNRRWLVRSA